MFAAARQYMLSSKSSLAIGASDRLQAQLDLVIANAQKDFVVMSATGGQGGGGTREVRMDSTLPTNGMGESDDKMDTDNASPGDSGRPASAGPAGSSANNESTLSNDATTTATTATPTTIPSPPPPQQRRTSTLSPRASVFVQGAPAHVRLQLPTFAPAPPRATATRTSVDDTDSPLSPTSSRFHQGRSRRSIPAEEQQPPVHASFGRSRQDHRAASVDESPISPTARRSFAELNRLSRNTSVVIAEVDSDDDEEEEGEGEGERARTAAALRCPGGARFAATGTVDAELFLYGGAVVRLPLPSSAPAANARPGDAASSSTTTPTHPAPPDPTPPDPTTRSAPSFAHSQSQPPLVRLPWSELPPRIRRLLAAPWNPADERVMVALRGVQRSNCLLRRPANRLVVPCRKWEAGEYFPLREEGEVEGRERGGAGGAGAGAGISSRRRAYSDSEMLAFGRGEGVWSPGVRELESAVESAVEREPVVSSPRVQELEPAVDPAVERAPAVGPLGVQEPELGQEPVSEEGSSVTRLLGLQPELTQGPEVEGASATSPLLVQEPEPDQEPVDEGAFSVTRLLGLQPEPAQGPEVENAFATSPLLVQDPEPAPQLANGVASAVSPPVARYPSPLPPLVLECSPSPPQEPVIAAREDDGDESASSMSPLPRSAVHALQTAVFQIGPSPSSSTATTAAATPARLNTPDRQEQERQRVQILQSRRSGLGSQDEETERRQLLDYGLINPPTANPSVLNSPRRRSRSPSAAGEGARGRTPTPVIADGRTLAQRLADPLPDLRRWSPALGGDPAARESADDGERLGNGDHVPNGERPPNGNHVANGIPQRPEVPARGEPGPSNYAQTQPRSGNFWASLADNIDSTSSTPSTASPAPPDTPQNGPVRPVLTQPHHLANYTPPSNVASGLVRRNGFWRNATQSPLRNEVRAQAIQPVTAVAPGSDLAPPPPPTWQRERRRDEHERIVPNGWSVGEPVEWAAGSPSPSPSRTEGEDEGQGQGGVALPRGDEGQGGVALPREYEPQEDEDSDDKEDSSEESERGRSASQ